GRRLMPSGKKVRKGTITQYRCVLALLEEFESLHEISLRIQLLHRGSLRDVQKEKNYWTRFFKQFSAFLYRKKNCYDQYVGSVFKVIKTFFRYLLVEKALPVGEFHKKFRVPSEKFTPVILSPSQLNFLITNKEFEGSLPIPLKKVKDIFVFGYTVALRYQDLMQMKKTNVQQAPDATYIILHTQKTGAEIKIPLPGYAISIIHKYRGSAGKHVLPRLSCTNMNLGIKKLISLAGWNYNLPKFRNRVGEQVEIKTRQAESFKFCDHITAHTMRRTAITTLLLLGVDENSVRRISGHAPGSKEFYRYVVVVQEYLNSKVKEAHFRLLNDINKVEQKVA
ncbi:MAG TPA: tyrosine-type recombinase/integrase, partial [Ferruginibacter sp.]|nr:tyrosine-type recombinase/integrase [Ferruginibacter sp.]